MKIYQIVDLSLFVNCGSHDDLLLYIERRASSLLHFAR